MNFYLKCSVLFIVVFYIQFIVCTVCTIDNIFIRTFISIIVASIILSIYCVYV